ncbi:hypothetical protein HMPREF0185_02266, partial [Brevundimonas diminuta 470-4]
MNHFSRALTAAAFLALAASASAQTPAADTPVIAYHGAILIDGTGAAPRRGTTILVQGERILAIQPDAAAAPQGAERVDVSGLHVLPGLIDSHVHIATPPNADRAHVHMRRWLYSGVTAVRGMADDLRSVGELARQARVGE